MEVKEITDKKIWEDFFSICEEKTFLQSWNWGELQKIIGNKILRFGVFSDGKIKGLALVIKIIAKRGTFLFIPHGPVMDNELTAEIKKEILELLMIRIKGLAQKEKVDFIRITPILSDTNENNTIFTVLGFRDAPMHSSAYEATWKLNILPTESVLFKNMRKTTRYLIKKISENKNIKIIKSNDERDIEIYQKLNKEVSKRQKFVPFSDKFIKNEFDIFLKDNQSVLIFGKYNGEVVAGALIIFWSGMAFYHQAASLGKFAKFSVPYLLQWEAIKEAKKRGCFTYDFWGFTDPIKYPKHPWAGPTLFKMGFGGQKYEYVKTQDFVVSPKYWLNYIIEKARKIKRGL